MWRIAIPKKIVITKVFVPESDRYHAHLAITRTNSETGGSKTYYVYYDQQFKRFGKHHTKRVLRKNGPMRFELPDEYWLTDDPEQLLRQAQIYLKRIDDEEDRE